MIIELRNNLINPILSKFTAIYEIITNPSFGAVKNFIGAWNDRPRNGRRTLAEYNEMTSSLHGIHADLSRQYSACQLKAITDHSERARCWLIMQQIRVLDAGLLKARENRRELFLRKLFDSVINASKAHAFLFDCIYVL